MNTCPNCGKIAGLHSSILQGCMCQYSMQAPPQRTWIGLTDEEIDAVTDSQWAKGVNKPIYAAHRAYARAIEAKLKERNT